MLLVNTGTTRIVIVVGLVVAGLVVLLNGFSGVGTTAASGGSPGPSHSTSPGPSHSPSVSTGPAVHHHRAKDISFVVLNGTNAVGLAAQYDTTLSDAGFTQGHLPG